MENLLAPDRCSIPPTARKVLVLAPHPDDEIFGCGGLLTLYAGTGTEIDVYVLTDGAGYADTDSRAQICAQRMEETNQALALLGIRPAHNLGYKDRMLARTPNLHQSLAALLKEKQPDLVLIPSLWEIHPDHLAVARAFLLAMQLHDKRGGELPLTWSYEIGSPLRCTHLIDITPVWAQKQDAMQVFASQLKFQDYARHITALNAYRTYSLPKNIEYAEAYLQVDANEVTSANAVQLLNSRLHAALVSATVEIEILREQVGGLKKNLLEADAQSLAYARENESLRNDNSNILNSTSWRLTAPLRWLTHWRKDRKR